MPMAAAASAPMPELIVLLERQIADDGITGREMARECGIDLALWSRVRRGVNGEQFGIGACARIVGRYPHLKEAAMLYVLERYPHMRQLLAKGDALIPRSPDGP